MQLMRQKPPLNPSRGGKERLGNISKRGDRYLRSLFTTGALAVIRYAKLHGAQHRPWLTALLARRPTKVAAIAPATSAAHRELAMVNTAQTADMTVDRNIIRRVRKCEFRLGSLQQASVGGLVAGVPVSPCPERPADPPRRRTN